MSTKPEDQIFDLVNKIRHSGGRHSDNRTYGRGSGTILRENRPRSADAPESKSRPAAAVPPAATAPLVEKKQPAPKTRAAKFPARTYSEQEQQQLLTGYELVERAAWVGIEPNTHIRYRKIDGSFVRGGFVIQIINNSAGKQFFRITNSLGGPNKPDYSTWSAAFAGISTVWKKSGVPRSNIENSITTMDSRVEKLNVNMNLMIKKIQVLESRLSDMERSHKMLLEKLRQKFAAT